MAFCRVSDSLRQVSLHGFELVITLGIITPCTLGYWRGVWNLLDLYLLPNDPNISGIISILIGLGLIFVFGLLQNSHKRWFPFGTVRWHVFSRLYSFLLAFAVLNHWRGLWALLDFYTTTSLTSALSTLVIGIIFLLLLRGIKNIPPQPSVVYRDNEETVFDCSTRFNVNSSEGSAKVKMLFILDLIVSYFVIHSLVLCFWRGLWATLDSEFLPQDWEISTYASLAIGYGTFLLCYLLQCPARKTSRTLANISFPLHVLFEDVYILIVSFAVVNVWRGLWNVCDLYILSDNFIISNVITAAVGTVVLYLLLAGRCLGAVGCFVDGDPSDGSGINFMHFFDKLNEPEKENETPMEEYSRCPDNLNNEESKKDVIVNWDPRDMSTKSSTAENVSREGYTRKQRCLCIWCP
ncbi:uncharacterized protein [Ptychodera flava]|uniref:uncharacterized protein n=1 Tax=Ptychodera flava TaxID=63121 RepID=UPI00396A0F59